MRTLVMILMATSAGLATFNIASAADAVDQIPEAPAATESYAAPAGSWAGAYVGGQATYDWGRFRKGDDFDADKFGGAIYGGYNMQSGQIVYGGEADIGYNGESGTAGPGLTGKQKTNGSVRARVGYDMNPFLIYGTGGLAVSSNSLSDGVEKDSKTALGYTVGAGVEAMVTNNITARVEYRYSDFQKKDFDLGGATYSRGFDDHSVKVGMGVKF